MGLKKEKCSNFDIHNNLTKNDWCECTSAAKTNVIINVTIKFKTLPNCVNSGNTFMYFLNPGFFGKTNSTVFYQAFQGAFFDRTHITVFDL